MKNHAAAAAQEIAFVDPGVSDLATLLRSLRGEVRPIILDPIGDPVRQMADALADASGLRAVHIIAHGAPGEIAFSAGALSLETVLDHERNLARIGAALATDGELLLWSCDTSQGSRGERFIEALCWATGAPVGAADSTIGAASLGGSWELDSRLGATMALAPLTPAGIAAYRGLMPAAVTAATLSSISPDTGSSSTDFDTSNTSALVLSGTDTDSGAVTMGVWLSGGAFSTLNGGKGILLTSISLAKSQTTWTSSSLNVASIVSAAGQTLTDGTYTISFTTGTSTSATTVGTSHTVTFDTTAPTAASITSVTDDVGSITGTLSSGGSTDDTNLTVKVSLSGTNAVAGDTIQIYNGTGTGSQLGTSYTLTSTDISNGFANVQTGTLTNGNTYTITARITDVAGNQSLVSSNSFVETVDTTAPTATATVTAISSDSGTSGDYITNVASQTVSGTYTGTLGSGESIQVSANGTTWVTATASGGTWSASGVTLSSGSGTLSVRTIDTAGNSTSGTGHSYTLDQTAPTATATVTAISADTGSSSTDFITATASQTVSGTFTGTLGSGESIQVSANGTTWVTATTSGSTWSASGVTLSSGSGTLSVRTTDTAGNTTSGTGHSYTLDQSAPTAPSTPDLTAGTDSGSSSTDNLTNVTTPTFTGTAEAGSTVTLYDTDGTTVLGSGTATGGNWSITASTLSSGSHTITAKATDAAGNTSAASGSLSVTIDTAAPAAPSTPDLTAGTDSGSSSTDNLTNVATPTFTGTAEAGSTVTLYDTDGTTVLGSGTATGGNWSITTSSLSSGSHTITAKATDAAGNTGTASSGLTITIDNTAPNAPSTPDLTAASDTGSSNTDNITSNTTPSFSGTAEAGSTVTLYDTNGTTVLGTATATGGNWSITTGTLSSGSHTITAKATDAAGNVSSASSGLTITIDNTAPNAPSTPDLTAGTDSGSSSTDNLTNVATPSFTGTAEAGSTVTLYDGASQIGSATADGSGNWSITASTLASGSHTISAKATDAAGNTSTASTGLTVTIDTAAPTAPSTPDLTTGTDSGSSSTDNLTNVTTPSFTGTAEAGSTVTLYDGASQIGSATADGSGNWSITASTLSSGSHTISAKATDAAGNTSAASGSLSVTIDTAAPAAPSIVSIIDDVAPDMGMVSSGGSSNDSTPTLAGTAEANSVVSIYDGASLLGTTTANGSGIWSFTTAALTQGSHSFTATATDAAGNTSSASSAYTETIDTAAPSAPAITSITDDVSPNTGTVSSGGSSNDTTPTLSGTAEGNSTVSIYDGATLLGTTTANGSGNWSYTTAARSEGSHSFTATATDAAGNVSAASTAYTETIDTTAPAAPSTPDMTAGTDSGSSSTDNLTNVATPTFTGTAEAGSTVTLYDTDGTTVLGSGTATGGNWSITTGTLSEGAHTITATATDAAGNSSAGSTGLSVTIDTIAPNAPSAPNLTAGSDSGSSSTDNITNDTTPTLSGTAEAGSTVAVYDGANLLGSTTADGSGDWTYTTTALSEGSHSITAEATDAAGNTGTASGSLSVAIDTTAPTIIFEAVTGNSSLNAAEAHAGFNITGSATEAAGETITLRIFDTTGGDHTQLGTDLTGTVQGDGTWSVHVAGDFGFLGDHSYVAEASGLSDTAGNFGIASEVFTADNSVPCFCRGTMIRTDRGEVAVEDLRVGDRVDTLFRGFQPIQWVGMGRSLITAANRDKVRPVIVRRGALGQNEPCRDLYLTKGHCLLIGASLIPVDLLVNHRSIEWDDRARVVEYYHIELDEHDALFADGTLAESYIDDGNRVLFHNTAEASDDPPMRRLAPVLAEGPELDRIWAELLERAGGPIEVETTDNPDLHLVVDGRRVNPVAADKRRYRFVLDRRPSSVLLRSRSVIPAALGRNREQRRLGVAITQIVLSQNGVTTEIGYDSELFPEGGHPVEPGFRWTKEELSFSSELLAQIEGEVMLDVNIVHRLRYPTSASDLTETDEGLVLSLAS